MKETWNAQKIRDSWKNSFLSSLQNMLPVRAELEWEPPTAPSADISWWWEQSFNFHSLPLAWVGAAPECWLTVGTSILRAAGIEEASQEEAQNTWMEVLTQSFSETAQLLSASLPQPVACSLGKPSATPPSGGLRFPARLLLPEHPPLHLMLVLEEGFPSLLAQLGTEPEPSQPQPAGGKDCTPFRTLELLKDVELPVSVSFGTTQLPLEEVLKLTAGSVIELDRSVDDPVALIVNNTVVALGEVVVIEGNYGVRIQRILSCEDLLRTSTRGLKA